MGRVLHATVGGANSVPGAQWATARGAQWTPEATRMAAGVAPDVLEWAAACGLAQASHFDAAQFRVNPKSLKTLLALGALAKLSLRTRTAAAWIALSHGWLQVLQACGDDVRLTCARRKVQVYPHPHLLSQVCSLKAPLAYMGYRLPQCHLARLARDPRLPQRLRVRMMLERKFTPQWDTGVYMGWDEFCTDTFLSLASFGTWMATRTGTALQL